MTLGLACVPGDSLAGCIGSFEQEGVHYIGYWIGEQFWRKEVATVALKLLLAEVANRFVRSLRDQHELPFRRMEVEPGEKRRVDFGTGAKIRKPDGTYAGKAVAESVDPTVVAAYLQAERSSRPYYNEAYDYDPYRMAYQSG